VKFARSFVVPLIIAATVFEVCNVPSPKTVNGVDQAPIEGKSQGYSFNFAAAKETHTV